MFNIIELNTMDNPSRHFMDETERLLCTKCGNWFRLGHGMVRDQVVSEITDKHMELCEGDAAITLMKVEQWYKQNHPDPRG